MTIAHTFLPKHHARSRVLPHLAQTTREDWGDSYDDMDGADWEDFHATAEPEDIDWFSDDDGEPARLWGEEAEYEPLDF